MLIDRYITKEVSFSFSVTFLTLIFIFFMYSLTTFLNEAASGTLSGNEIVILTLLKTFISFGVLIPLAYFLSIVIAFGKLNLNNELTALRVSGTSAGRIFSTIIVIAMILSAITATVSLHGRQWAYEKLYDLKDTIASKWEFDKVRAKRFYLSDNENQAIYIGYNDKITGEIKEVFIRNSVDDGFEIISAPHGSIQSFHTLNSHRLTLDNARIYKSDSDGNFFVRLDKLTLDVNAFKTITEKHRIKKEPNKIIAFSLSGAEKAEWQWRLAAPLSCLILAATALPLIRITPRKGRLAKMPLAITIYAVYYVTLGFSRTGVEQGTLENLWLGPFLFILILCFYYFTRRLGNLAN